MGLIFTNKKTLKNTAVIIFKNQIGDAEITDFDRNITIIKRNDNIVGLNIRNYKDIFDSKDGVHNLDKEQRRKIEKIIGDKLPQDHFFTVGKVLSRDVHPESKELFVLKVQAEKELQIVTNSTNSQPGSKVVVARVGSTLPSGSQISHSKIMGVDSEGMLCGGQTLNMEPTEGVLLVDSEEIEHGQEFKI